MNAAVHEQLQQRLGYRFADEQLLARALCHPSSSAQNYQRLEFLGDRFIGTLIAVELYKKFPDANEGELTLMQTHLVCGEMLTHLAQNLKLSEAVDRADTSHGVTASMLEDVFEALLGAVWLDCGNWDTASEVALRLFADELNELTPQSITKPAKSILQEHAQARGDALPQYKCVRLSGKAHKPEFEGHCKYAGKHTSAQARTKALAEGMAAQKMLELLS